MRRAGSLLAHHAVHFLQFLHQIVLGVQPAGRINEQIIGLARLGRRHRVVSNRGRVRAVSSGNDLDLHTLAPELELFDRSRAKSVTGRQEGGLSARFDQRGELGGGGGLAGAVDANHRDHRRT